MSSRDEELEKLSPLPLGVRLALLVLGWVLLLVGIAGLVLPGIQGVLTILLGAAVLSLGSETAYTWMRTGMMRWPSAWDRMEGFRGRLHGWLLRRWPDKAGTPPEASSASTPDHDVPPPSSRPEI